MVPDIVEIKRLCASGQWNTRIAGGKILLHDTVAGETVCVGQTDAEPVRHAEWIPWEHNGKVSKHLMTCSGCKRYQWPKNDVLAFDRCPKCGAMMIGGAK